MSCKYVKDGVVYTEEDLIKALATDTIIGIRSNNVYFSVATKKKQNKSSVYKDTMTLLFQRIKEAQNVIQATKRDSELTDEDKQKKVAAYRRIISETRNKINELKDKNPSQQLDYILGISDVDANLVESLYSAPNVTFSELQFANNIIESWKAIDRVLGITDVTAPDKAIQDKLADITERYAKLDRMSKNIAIQLIKKAAKGKLNEDDITKIVDTSWATEYTRELGTAGIPISNRLAYLIKEVNIKINMEHNDNWAEIDRRTKGITDYSIFLKRQKNKLGEETLGIVTRYTQTFWENLRGARRVLRESINKANGDKDKIKKAWKAFNTWNQANTVSFNSQFFIERDKYSDDMRNQEIKYLKSLGFNDKEIDNIILESFKRYEKFQSRLQDYKYEIEDQVAVDPSVLPTGMTADEYVKNKVEEYNQLHNPLIYLEQKFNNQQITAYGASRYTYLIPVKSINGKPTNYYDENFAKIADNPKLYEFYTWFTKFISDSLSWLPQEEIDDLQSNFLPVISGRLATEYSLTNLKDSVAGLGDWLMKAMTVSQFGKRREENPFSKQEIRKFEASFLNESIPVEERSTDLNLIAKIFSDMALIYKHKNTVKAEVDTINDLIQSFTDSYQIKFGKKERINKKPSSIQELAEYTVRAGFYGMRKDGVYERDMIDEFIGSESTFYDVKELISLGFYQSEKAKKAQKIEDEIKSINTELEDEKLSDDEREKKIEKLESLKAEYYKLGGRKFSAAQTMDSLVKSTRLTSLGFAPFSALRNLLVGKINNIFHASGGRDFAKTNLNKARKILRDSVAKYWSRDRRETENTRKLFGLLADSGMVEGEDGMYLTTMVSADTSIDKFRKMLPKAYSWLSGGDYYFRSEMLIAAMDAQKIKTADGKEVSFWDALSENRKYNEEKLGKWDAAANGNMTFEEYYIKNMLKYRQLANKLHGATGKDVVIKGKDSAIGRVLFLFKSWLPETVGVRFDPRHVDGIMEREEEGYYRTFFNLIKEKKAGIFKLMFDAMLQRDLGIEDELTLANFKKMMKELQVIAALYLSYALLKAMAPDDDKNKKLYNLLVLRQLYDLRRDLTYYGNLNSLNELQRQPFPIFRTLINFGDATKAATYYTLGVENEDGEIMYDGERTALKISKVIPVVSNVNRIQYYMKQVD